MRVLKVMFGAVITAAVGLSLLRAVGVLDWEAVFVNPTHLGAQALGGLIFGVGFVVGGHCPGTAMVSCATGRLNGMVFLLGVMLGALGFAAAYPGLAEFANAGGERVTLDQWLGLSFQTTTLLVVLMALAMFVGAEYLERVLARRHREAPSAQRPLAAVRGIALATLALAAVAMLWPRPGQPIAAQSTQPASVSPFELARSLRASPPDQVVWVSGTPRHALGPGALAVDGASDAQLAALADPGRRVILVFADGTRAGELATRLAARGVPCSVLAGGLDAWDTAMQVAPQPPAAGARAETWQRYREDLALQAYFAGTRVATPAVAAPAALPLPATAVASSKREGC
jgi:uncharacterized membrane protein YedE/YeeE